MLLIKEGDIKVAAQNVANSYPLQQASFVTVLLLTSIPLICSWSTHSGLALQLHLLFLIHEAYHSFHTECPFVRTYVRPYVRPKTSKSSDHHCRPGLCMGWPSGSLVTPILHDLRPEKKQNVYARQRCWNR